MSKAMTIATKIHRMIAQSFYSMAPALHRERVLEAREKKLPMLGVDIDGQPTITTVLF